MPFDATTTAPTAWAHPPALTDDQRPVWLRTARPMDRTMRPTSPGAKALVEAVSMALRQAETRDRARRKDALEGFNASLGTIVGGLLRPWTWTSPAPAYTSRGAGDFPKGGPVRKRQFIKALDGLVEADLVAKADSKRFLAVWGGFRGWSGVYWPTPSLVDLAARYGVTPDTFKADFTRAASKAVPRVPVPIQVSALRKHRGQQRVAKRAPTVLGHRLGMLEADVRAANAFAAKHEVAGCLPPRWKRSYVETEALMGRWHAMGADAPYQGLPKAERLRITIDGDPVCEVDVKGSHLMLMHGLLGFQGPQGDPYRVGKLPRSIVKLWLTRSLGLGKAVTKWSDDDAKAGAGHDAKEVSRIMTARYPFLSAPGEAVAGPARLLELGHLGTPGRLLTLRLQGIEADCMSRVMRDARAQGILVLPIHDSVVVAQRHLETVQGFMVRAWRDVGGVRVETTVA